MSEYQNLRKNILFSDLTHAEFQRLLKISKTIILKEGDCFIHEGEEADKFYFIVSGHIIITKSGTQNEHEHFIAELSQGETVGEIALLDHRPRSASAKAITESVLLSFSLKELNELAAEYPSFNKVLMHLTANISTRVRKTTTAFVIALEKQLNEYKMRDGLGFFMVETIIALCLFTFFLSWITTQNTTAIASTVISLPLTLGFVILFFSIMKSSNLPLKIFGLTTKNWRVSIVESMLFTIILCFLVQMVKWILVSTTDAYMGQPLFSPYITINPQRTTVGLSEGALWLIIFTVYCLVISPLQELIVRGGLQGPLEIFLTGRYVKTKAILVSNIMFSTTHLFMGINISLLVFLAGLYFGWLYSRHHTLIGVIIAHAMLGTWTTMVVGF